MKPLSKRGLNGLSTERAQRISFVEGLPSLLKKPPGILPAAYVFSLNSTVKGKKSANPDCFLEATAEAKTIVSPAVAITEPSACFAIFPVLRR